MTGAGKQCQGRCLVPKRDMCMGDLGWYIVINSVIYVALL
jgi:hypothetical protein